MAGGVAGMVGKSSVAPLERVKILFQVKTASYVAPCIDLYLNQTGKMKDLSVLATLRKISKSEGILGLFK